MASPIKNSDQGGKRPGQKYKSLLVWQYLLKKTDEDHAASSETIKEHLKEYGITADRHSIARDIEALQDLFCRDFYAYADEVDDDVRLNYEITLDKKLHGYKIAARPYAFDEIRLLAECVNAAKFLTPGQADNLKAVIGNLCSEAQREQLDNDVYVVDKAATANSNVLPAILALQEAIKQKRKVKFRYMTHTIERTPSPTPRGRGKDYILNPFQLLMNEGNYYLLAYNEAKGSMTTYRIDRMRSVGVLDDERIGDEAFVKLDMRTYNKRNFSMFDGETYRVTMRFTTDKIDPVVERFGKDGNALYRLDDKGHFLVTADVGISDAFYSWISSFRKKATIISPPEVVEGMKAFLKDIETRYE